MKSTLKFPDSYILNQRTIAATLTIKERHNKGFQEIGTIFKFIATAQLRHN